MAQVAAGGDDIKGADSDDVLETLLPSRRNDSVIGDPFDLPLLRGFPLQFEPKALDFLDGGQLAAGSHFRREVRQELRTVGVFDVREGVLELRSGVAGNLLQDTEEFT